MVFKRLNDQISASPLPSPLPSPLRTMTNTRSLNMDSSLRRKGADDMDSSLQRRRGSLLQNLQKLPSIRMLLDLRKPEIAPEDSVEPEPKQRRTSLRRVSCHRMEKSTLEVSPPGVPPPPLELPEPIPAGCRYPYPTSNARLPHECISTDITVELKAPGKYTCESVTPNEDDDDIVEEIHVPKIKFQRKVRTMEIPSHVHYAQEVREKLWYDRKERIRMVNRNTMEFEHDQEDWRNCLEEDQMVQHRGRLLHPKTHEVLMKRIARRKQENFRRVFTH